MPKTLVIINPASGGGRAKALGTKIEGELAKTLGGCEIRWAKGKNDLRRLAEEAVEFSLVVACGGDGTISEVANGLFRSGRNLETVLGILSIGTGGDLIRSLRIPHSLKEQIELLQGRQETVIDVGRVEYQTEDHRQSRIFLNIADAGMGTDVLKRLGEHRRRFGRNFAYVAASFASYLKRRPLEVQITLDGEKGWQVEALVIAVANGQSFGGGMRIAPKADLRDGLFDVVILKDFGPPWVPIVTPLLYSGRLGLLPQVQTFKARQVEIVSPTTVELDIDGELIGALPARFELLPRSIRVKAP